MVRPRTILCVDDNPALRDNLREILEDAGYRVREAGSFAEALVRAREGFEVALVDLRLPDGDGTLLAARLREIIPEAQIIVLTGFATIESATAAVRAGAWAYLIKPCATPDLLIAVEQAIRQIEHVEEKRDLARRAHVAERLATIGTLTAGLSHEIKNPLNAALLQLTVLGRRLRRLPLETRLPLEEPLELVKQEIDRLNGILEAFLQFARPREMRPSAVDLAGLLGRVADLLAPQAEEAGVRLERQWPALLEVTGDDQRLQQAIVNLVLNAVQATPAGGVVRLAAGAEPTGRVWFSVEDSGPGIPEEMRARIFEPFFTTKPMGSGLGLPLVHRIVEEHEGTIAIDRAEAGGARFLVRLR